MKTKLFANPCAVTIPAGQDDQLEGIIDLIGMKLVTRDTTDKTNRKFFINDVPEKYLAEAKKRRAEMLDAVSAASDEVTNLILEEKDVPIDMIRAALRKGTLDNIFTPVHCGSSKMFHGVQQLLDLVVDCSAEPGRSVRRSMACIRRRRAHLTRKPEPSRADEPRWRSRPLRNRRAISSTFASIPGS